MEIISSRNNKKITEAIKLKDKKTRDKCNLFCFEGHKLFCEAISAGIVFSDVFVSEKYIKTHNMPDGVICTHVTDGVYEKLSDDKAPDGIFCVAVKPDISPKNEKRFIACSLSDPGNVGTLIRTAAAFGVGELILCDNCADPFSPKSVRSSMGAAFKVSIKISDSKNAIDNLKKNGYNLCAAALTPSAVDLRKINIDCKTCFVIGNEGHGLSEETISLCDMPVIIPMDENTESLNAASAATVLMWELSKNG